MSHESRKEQLFRRTLAARGKQAGRRPGNEQPPRPGDLFVFPETARFSVEWAVIAEDSDVERRLLVTPADLHPLAGSSDVSIAPGSVSGSLTVRCGLAVWISESVFDVEQRTGRLAPEDLERAQSKRAEVAAGSVTGSVRERETETEPEYQDLKRELAQAQAALLAAPRHRAIVAARGPMHGEPGAPPVAAFRPRATWQSFGSLYGLAASILLVSTLGLGGALTWQHRDLVDLEREREASDAAYQQEIEERDAARRSVERAYRQEVEQRRQLEEGYQQEIDALERRLGASSSAASAEPQINLPIAFFPAVGSLRGPARTVTLPAASSLFLIVIDVKENFPLYRLEVGAEGETQPLWRSDRLSAIGHTELSVVLPRRSFPAGQYWLRLSGLDGEEAEPLTEYRMNVEVE